MEILTLDGFWYEEDFEIHQSIHNDYITYMNDLELDTLFVDH